MMTSSNGNIFRVTGLLCGEFTGRAHYDVIVMLMFEKDIVWTQFKEYHVWIGIFAS